MFEQLKGRRLTLTDVIYRKESKTSNYHDYISMVYYDNVTGKKELFTIEDPMFTIYEVKEEFRTFRKARHFLPMEQLIPHEIHYKDRLKEIAKIGGPGVQQILRNAKTNQEKKILYKYPYVLGADIGIETYYRVIWEKEVGNDTSHKPTCIFLDIEVDQKHWTGAGIPRNGECPIDAISIVDEAGSAVHQFLLKTPDNPLIDEMLQPEKLKEVHKRFHEMFDESYGELQYKIYMFDNEAEMLRKCFSLIHTLKRDFCMIWNGMDFDIPFIIGRAEELGMKPEDLFCHSDFPYPTMFLFEDTHAYEFDKKRSYFECASYTHWLDQMITYASLRKSQGAIRRMSLNAIAKHELGDAKLDYTETGNFVNFSRLDYILYILYNVKDTLLQKGIDLRCMDSFSFYNSCYNSFCQYKDGLKQTVSLRAFIYKEFIDDGLILGHNVNFGDRKKPGPTDEQKARLNEMDSDSDPFDFGEDTDDDSYAGAINGNPELNSHTGLSMFGTRSMYLFGASIDFDFSAMYPNSIVAFNIFATTMYGKLEIDGGEKYCNYDIDPGKEFVEDIITKDNLHTVHKWLGLPSFDELYEIMKETAEAA